MFRIFVDRGGEFSLFGGSSCRLVRFVLLAESKVKKKNVKLSRKMLLNFCLLLIVFSVRVATTLTRFNNATWPSRLTLELEKPCECQHVICGNNRGGKELNSVKENYTVHGTGRESIFFPYPRSRDHSRSWERFAESSVACHRTEREATRHMVNSLARKESPLFTWWRNLSEELHSKLGCQSLAQLITSGERKKCGMEENSKVFPLLALRKTSEKMKKIKILMCLFFIKRAFSRHYAPPHTDINVPTSWVWAKLGCEKLKNY